MTMNELLRVSIENKDRIVKTKEDKIKNWCTSLYNDCKADLEQDRKSHLNTYPDTHTAFDLFIDNLIFLIEEKKFDDVYIVRLLKDLNKNKLMDCLEFAY